MTEGMYNKISLSQRVNSAFHHSGVSKSVPAEAGKAKAGMHLYLYHIYHCGFESRPGLLHTKVYSAFHPSGVGKWVPAGMAKAGMAHCNCGWTCGWAGKSVRSFENTCHTWALLRWWFTTKRRYIKCMHVTLPFYKDKNKGCWHTQDRSVLHITWWNINSKKTPKCIIRRTIPYITISVICGTVT